MRIGIDMRMAGTGEGIGRYAENLVNALADIDRTNQYFLLFSKQESFLKGLSWRRQQFRQLVVRSPYYSFSEQTTLLRELLKLKLDLMHFSNFNFPVFYPRKFVVTIHDMIHHNFPGKKKSRYFHRVAYRFVFRQALVRSVAVIAVSKATKNDILHRYRIPSRKVSVVYEGISKSLPRDLTPQEVITVEAKYGINRPYLLFVGVWRQYKNLPRLARAFEILAQKYHLSCQLVLAGKIDPFYPKIKNEVLGVSNAAKIEAVGYVQDEELSALYEGAAAFVLPSLVEGFGLIGVEAQSFGLPVAASDIPVLREILGDGALYFNPFDPSDMAAKLQTVMQNQEIARQISEKGWQNQRKFDWTKTAQETLAVYQEAVRSPGERRKA